MFEIKFLRAAKNQTRPNVNNSRRQKLKPVQPTQENYSKISKTDQTAVNGC